MAAQGKKPRGSETALDMVRSLGLVLLAVGFVAGVVALSRQVPERESLDWQAVVSDARADSDFSALAPTTLEGDWTSTAAAFDAQRQILKLSFVSPEGDYVGLTQQSVDVQGLIDERLDAYVPVGDVVIDGRTWVSFVESEQSGDQADVALLLNEAQRGVVLISSGTAEELQDFAAGLS